ncbi:MAG: glycosyltransferase [bacterium]|nr:glycosyltransferase [bacterium]
MRNERPLRVLRIIDRLNVGGPTKHVTWLTAGLASAGAETTLVTGTIAPGEGDMSWFARDAGVAPVVLPTMSRALGLADVRVAWQLYRLMRRLRPDVVHTHKAKAGAVGRAAALLYRWTTPSALVGRPRPLAVVHTFHGHVFHGYYGRLASRAFVWIERVLARLGTDRIVTISAQQRSEVVGRYAVGTPQQTVVVPLGLDLPEPGDGARVRAELGMADGEVLIGIVGRLCEVKDHATMLAAFVQLVAGGVHARLAIVGDGHLRAELEAAARAAGVAERVHFLGFRDDMADVYAALDVCALTSVNEGTPLTLLEAMACGRPVAATAVGGVVDILGARQRSADGVAIWEHGVTAPAGDAAAFAVALRHLALRPAARSLMGASGRAWVMANMTADRLIRDMGRLYERLARERAIVREGVWDAGADHGRSGVHRVAFDRALPDARGLGVHDRRSVDGVDREHPAVQGPSALPLPH